MKKDDILNASRKEHKNKDLAEIEVIYQAGSHAGRVGALVCCLLSLLSSMLAHTMIYSPWVRGESMKEQLHLKNHLKEVRMAANLSQAQLAEMVGVSRNTISSIETGQFNPTAKLALILCIALDKKFEELFYF